MRTPRRNLSALFLVLGLSALGLSMNGCYYYGHRHWHRRVIAVDGGQQVTPAQGAVSALAIAP